MSATAATAEVEVIDSLSGYRSHGFDGYGLGRSLSKEVGSWSKKASGVWDDTVGRVVEAAYAETLRAWKKSQNPSKAISDTIDRVAGNLARELKHAGSGDWWTDTALRGLSRAVAAEIVVAVLGSVFPPLAIIASAAPVFFEQFGPVVALGWQAGTSPTFYAYVFPDETSKLLGEVVKGVNKVDLFQTLPTLALTELVVQGQTSRAKRDALRMKVAEIQAKYAGEAWVIAARAAFDVAQATVITVATFGAGAAVVAAIEGAKLAISAATTLLQLQMALETARVVKREVERQTKEIERQQLAEIAALEAEIAAINREVEQRGAAPEVSGDTAVAVIEVETTRAETFPGPCCDDVVETLRGLAFWPELMRSEA